MSAPVRSQYKGAGIRAIDTETDCAALEQEK
jgi:hypothetical protein